MSAKRFLLALLSVVCCLSAAGCTSTGLPISDSTPSVTLPPAEVNFVAPIGDAALEYTAPAILHLPSHDGLGLTTVQTEVAYSPVRPNAESLVRALLAYPSSEAASSIGGSVRLTLYGTSPVEVSRDVVTINLSASALQLDREALYIACQGIANTLTELPGIQYVNILVADNPIGIDVANTLPMGAFQRSTAADLGAVYDQLLSRRITSTDVNVNKPFSANVTLYFPLCATDGMVAETRAMSFENQVHSDVVVSILRQLAAGPSNASINSPALPLLADLLASTPTLVDSEQTGGAILHLDFAHNLDDMLEAYGITRKQSMASLCYTFSTFLPNVRGISVSINGEAVDSFLLSETEESPGSALHLRNDFSAMLYDYCTLYFADLSSASLRASKRPVMYYHRSNPRILLQELSHGPQPCDSEPELAPVMLKKPLADIDMLGFALSDSTLLVNFSSSFDSLDAQMTAEEERLLAYSLVNTLCVDESIKSVCFFQSGSQFESASGHIYWPGLFYPLSV